MSVTVNLKDIDGLPSKGDWILKVDIRGNMQSTRSIQGDNSLYVGEEFKWPIGRKLSDRDNLVITLITYKFGRFQKEVGSITVNLTILAKRHQVELRETFVDSNGHTTPIRLKFEIIYHSPDTQVGGMEEDHFDYVFENTQLPEEKFDVGNNPDDDNLDLMLGDGKYGQIKDDESIFSSPSVIDGRLKAMMDANIIPGENFQIAVKIIRCKELIGNNVNPYVKIKIGNEIKKTAMKLYSNNPFYNEFFLFDFHMPRSAMMETVITLTVVSEHALAIKRILPGVVIGVFDIDCKQIYDQTDHSIRGKYALLIDPKDPIAGSKGYVQVEMGVYASGEAVRIVEKSTLEDDDKIEENLIMPRQLKDMKNRQMTDVTIKIYRAEDLPPMNTQFMTKIKRGLIGSETEMCDPYVDVAFGGRMGRTSVKKFSYNPEWNQEIVFTDYFPPLVNTIKFTIRDWDSIKDETISSFRIDLRKIMKLGIDGYLPSYGPAWVNLYGTPREYVSKDLKKIGDQLNENGGEGIAYRGRILIAIKSKVNLDADKAGVAKAGISGASDFVCGRKVPHLLFATIYDGMCIDKDIGSQKKQVSFEMSIGIYGNELDRKKGAVFDITPEAISSGKGTVGGRALADWYLSTTPAYVPIKTNEIYYHIDFQRSKPCLYLLNEFEDVRVRSCVPNIIEKLRDKILYGVEEVRYSLRKNNVGEARHRYRKNFLAFKPILEDAIVEIKSCKGTAPQTFIDREYKRNCRIYLETLKKLIDTRLTKNLTKENLSQRMREANTIVKTLTDLINPPQNSIPDVFIHMIMDGERIAYCRIPSRDIFHSASSPEKGKWSGQVATFYFKKPGLMGMNEGGYRVQCQLRMYIWLGLVKDFPSFRKGIPLGYDATSFPELDPPKTIIYNETSVFELRAYIFLARKLLPLDETGFSDPQIRLIFGNTVLSSHVCFETISPLFDECLTSNKIVFCFKAQFVKEMQHQIVLEVYDLDTTNRNRSVENEYKNENFEFMGRSFCTPKVYLKGETYKTAKMRWWPIYKNQIKAGEVLAAFDLVNVSDRLRKSDEEEVSLMQGFPTVTNIVKFTKEFNDRVLLTSVNSILRGDYRNEEVMEEGGYKDSDDEDEIKRRELTKYGDFDIGFAPAENLQFRPQHALRIPLGIRPELAKFRVEALFWGMREMKSSFKLVPYRSPRMMVDLAGSKLYSKIIADSLTMPNFTDNLENLNLTYVDLYLPKDYRLWPPISILCTNYRIGGIRNIVGTSTWSNIGDFMKLSKLTKPGDKDYDEDSVEESDMEGKKDDAKSVKTRSVRDEMESEDEEDAPPAQDKNKNSSLGIPNPAYDDDLDEVDGDNNSREPIVNKDDEEATTEKAEELKQSPPGIAKKVWTQSNLPKDEFNECDWWSRYFATLSNIKQEIEDKSHDLLTDSDDSDFLHYMEDNPEPLNDIDDNDPFVEVPSDDENGKKKKFWQFWKKEKKKLTAKERREKLKQKRRKKRLRQEKLKKLLINPEKNYQKELEEEVLEFDQKEQDTSWIERITIMTSDLEKVSKFHGFQEPLKSLPIYRGKHHDEEATSDSRIVGFFKGDVKIYEIDENEGIVEDISQLKLSTVLLPKPNMNMIINLYIIRAIDLHPIDRGGLADPYLMIQCGEQIINERGSYKANTLNPLFGNYYSIKAALPHQDCLYIRILDKNSVGSDKLIGETKIDLEARVSTPHRATVGLAKKFYTVGYCKWRDQQLPSKILENLCFDYKLDPPVYDMENSTVTVNGVSFTTDTDILNEQGAIIKSNEPLALEALHKWGDKIRPGYPLVEEHIETRSLFTPERPGLSQGLLQMWVDIFDKTKGEIPNLVNIAPREAMKYQLRVIVWNTYDVLRTSTSIFSNDKSADIYVKGWMKGFDQDGQITDVHNESLSGEGNFNWRFIFDFEYLKNEDKVQFQTKKVFNIDPITVKGPCELTIQIWDHNLISSDKFLGSLVLPLKRMPRGSRRPNACGLHQLDKNCIQVSLFKNKEIRGWWPCVFKEDDDDILGGKVELGMTLLSLEDADSNPAGMKREAPQPLPDPIRPGSNFGAFMGPLGTILYLIKVKLKWILIKLAIATLIILIFALFIYAAPGYIMKKILGA